MENTQGKKPAEWFEQLKEPYRSEAIANIEHHDILSEMSYDSLARAFNWAKSIQGLDYWSKIYNSIEAGETTYLEPELIGNTDNLKPEQMESGKWYVIETVYLWLIKFKNITNQNVSVYKSICIDSLVKYKYEDFNQCKIQHIKSIRHATNEEVLKYFDETFENVSLINEGNNTQVTEQQNQIEPEKVEVDWKAKFEELQKRYEVLVTESHKLDVLSGEMCDKYSELKEQVKKQNNEEKVYFYHDDISWSFSQSLNDVLIASREDYEIYEAVKIGVKKSVLVNENS